MFENFIFGNGLSSISPELQALLAFIILWDAVWKLAGMWKAGRNNQLWWFVFIGVLNTAGILPVLYLGFFQKKVAEKKRKKVKRKK